MKQVNYDYSKYDHKDELKALVNSVNESFEKFAKSFDGRKTSLTRIESNINKKNLSLDKLNETKGELEKRVFELESLKANTLDEIKGLDEKKALIHYEDSEVQRMEVEDISSLIESKKTKISKINEKIDATKVESKNNDTSIEGVISEINALESEKKERQESLYRTDALLKLISGVREELNDGVEEILKRKFEELNEESPKEEVKEETVTLIEDVQVDETNSASETEEMKITSDNEQDDFYDTDELSILDFKSNNASSELTNLNDDDSAIVVDGDYKKVIEETFNKEGINFNKFDKDTQDKLIDNADRVLKNIIVLKKHMIPLELTLNQSEVYYNVDPQNLDDLLNIITTSEDGNGMGFGIDYTFYILNELSRIDVDKLISTYNDEFMNITSKSGVIGLLKLADNNIGDFENNRKANLNILESLGINSGEEIAQKYPEFIDLDNPLFVNVLNIFDKDDLVSKLNSDIKIIPKILDYWKNN